MTEDHVAMGGSQKWRLVQNLLPGILDDIVLSEIVPKLHWRDFFILASTSHVWYDAIRSGQVFRSRALSHSTETLIAAHNRGDQPNVTDNAITLFAMGDNSWHKLPLIPNIREGQHGIPMKSECISLDGKIYIIGGMVDSEISNKVFVFDVARQGNWQQCASMKHWRIQFGSAVFDGKIYVFGGKTRTYPFASSDRQRMSRPTQISDSEVYDPKEDTWSTISPMTTCRSDCHVTTIGEELFVYHDWTTADFKSIFMVYSVDAYHPLKDEWRVVHSSWNWKQPLYVIFTFQENIFLLQPEKNRYGVHGFFRIPQLHIYKYDIDENSWIDMHSFKSFNAHIVPAQNTSDIFWPVAIVAADEELIAVVNCIERGSQTLCLFQSRGFNHKGHEISWELRGTTFSEVENKTPCLIQNSLVGKLLKL